MSDLEKFTDNLARHASTADLIRASRVLVKEIADRAIEALNGGLYKDTPD